MRDREANKGIIFFLLFLYGCCMFGLGYFNGYYVAKDELKQEIIWDQK